MKKRLAGASVVMALLLVLAVAPQFVRGQDAEAESEGRVAEAEARLERALLAVEEAELRERVMTALAVAEGVRLRGRTVLVAISELARVRETLKGLGPLDERRQRVEKRMLSLEGRRAEVSAELDVAFGSYVEVVSELGGDLWPRFRRVSKLLAEELESRRLQRLAQLLPLLTNHVESFNRDGFAEASEIERWRREVDDTYAARQERFLNQTERENRDLDSDSDADRDI